MPYFPLPRRYRPQSFEELIGQEEVVQTLVNGVEQARIAHAYLFYGPRGVGKTTVARILAKALNCKKGITSKPCQECVSCQEITQSISMDVHEIDGASHTGVDHVRELIDIIAYPPARDRYKIFIIDEVHMLSNAAFNALLKTLEEPPPHACFIFATTERHKIPATILSRCQQFGFRLLPPHLLKSHLEKIIQKEGVTMEEGALRRLIRASGGSVRDALSILDQLIALGGDKVEERLIRELLGDAPMDLVLSVFTAALEGDPQRVLHHIQEVQTKRFSLPLFLDSAITTARQTLMLRLGDPGEALTEEEIKGLKAFNQKVSYEELLRMYNFLLTQRNLVDRSEYPHWMVELIFLKLAELPKLRTWEEQPTKRVKQKIPQKKPPSSNLSKDFEEILAQENPTLVTYLEQAEIHWEDHKLTILFPNHTIVMDLLINHKVSLEKAATQYAGKKVEVEIACRGKEEKKKEKPQPLDEDLQLVLSLFGGKVVEMKYLEEKEEDHEY